VFDFRNESNCDLPVHWPTAQSLRFFQRGCASFVGQSARSCRWMPLAIFGFSHQSGREGGQFRRPYFAEHDCRREMREISRQTSSSGMIALPLYWAMSSNVVLSAVAVCLLKNRAKQAT
jgi:hypothetical protein